VKHRDTNGRFISATQLTQDQTQVLAPTQVLEPEVITEALDPDSGEIVELDYLTYTSLYTKTEDGTETEIHESFHLKLRRQEEAKIRRYQSAKAKADAEAKAAAAPRPKTHAEFLNSLSQVQRFYYDFTVFCLGDEMAERDEDGGWRCISPCGKPVGFADHECSFLLTQFQLDQIRKGGNPK
jgi:hypothetical protein